MVAVTPCKRLVPPGMTVMELLGPLRLMGMRAYRIESVRWSVSRDVWATLRARLPVALVALSVEPVKVMASAADALLLATAALPPREISADDAKLGVAPDSPRRKAVLEAPAPPASSLLRVTERPGVSAGVPQV